MSLGHIRQAYFLGIGGIGMSAIARYYNAAGIKVWGYDKTPSDLTSQLIEEGIGITFTDSVDSIPEAVLNHPQSTIFIFTPAIPQDHIQWNYIQSKGWPVFKRSEILGMLSRNAFTIAVAGTHGKTTTSTMIAHILHQCNVNFTAFLGGISANYNTNFIHKSDGTDLFPDKEVIVLEADEFDRSFHRLSPDIAVITAVDPDHLDIYDTKEAFFEAFSIFAGKIKPGGHLVLNSRISIELPQNIQTATYGLDSAEKVNFSSHFDGIRDGYFRFNYSSEISDGEVTADRSLHNIAAGLPGFHNIENATAAIGVCMDLLNLEAYDVKDAVKSFAGARRRFEFVFRSEKYNVIDDYAHHPEELRAIISSVKELYPGQKLSIIFQPHLFTRTRDFAEGFAQTLAIADEVVLMDIYPARELPIPGITSSWLLSLIPQKNKMLLDTQGILHKISEEKPGLLLITGAGDIDRIVPKVKEVYETF